MSVALVLATVPCLFWLWSVLRHDDHEREPWGLVALAVALGALTPFGVLCLRPLLEQLLHPVGPLLDAFVVTALGEEAVKLLGFVPFLFLRELDEPLDGGVYGAAVGLGFAACENVFFVSAGGGASLALQRVFTATLLHMACTGCVGIALATARLRPSAATIALAGSCFVGVVALHGLYDHFLTGPRWHTWLALLGVLPAALAMLLVKLRWARRRSPSFHRDR